MTKNDTFLSSSDMSSSERPFRLGYLLIDDFAMMSYAAIAEPFRAANVLSSQILYQWRHFSTGREFVTASSGTQVRAEGHVGEAADVDMLLVFAGGNPAVLKDPATFMWLRQLAARGVKLGGISGGPYLLARAGLLDDHRCTIHWEHRPAFAEEFPDIRVLQSLYVIDRDRLTCAGGTAGLDLSIDLIATQRGQALADRIGEWYIRTQLRDASAGQRMSLGIRYGTANEKLLAALALMETNTEDALSRATLAAQAGVSVRQLERLFASQLGSSLSTEYRKIRLARANALLRETSLSVTNVAIACGFTSASHFSRMFTRQFGKPPRKSRMRQS